MNEVKQASPDHPIHELLTQRWSPYAFDARPVSEQTLCALFEAARWAPSSYNAQPWSYVVATQAQPAAFQRLVECLVEGNQVWAKSAPALAIGCSRLNFEHNGQPNAACLHDLGLASANLTLEATARGLYVHQMIGILPDKARELFAIPEDVRPLTGLAIGYVAPSETLPEKLRERDENPRQRKSIDQFVFGDRWGTPASWTTT